MKTAKNHKTAVYFCLINENGDLVSAVADMGILEHELTPQHIVEMEPVIKKCVIDMIICVSETLVLFRALLIFMDGNISQSVIRSVCEMCSKHKVPIFVDPTSNAKSLKFTPFLSDITFLKPNEFELVDMAKQLIGEQPSLAKKVPAASLSSLLRSTEGCVALLLEAGVKHLLLTRGKEGVFHYTKIGNNTSCKHYPALPISHIVKVTGAGDNFCGGFIYGIVNGYSIEMSIRFGLRASRSALESDHAVNPNLNENVLL